MVYSLSIYATEGMVRPVFTHFFNKEVELKTFILTAFLCLVSSIQFSYSGHNLQPYWLPEEWVNLPDKSAYFEGCIMPIKIENGKVYFPYSMYLFDGRLVQICDFPEKQLIKDPRKTKRWKGNVTKKYQTVWEGIEECAGTWRMPYVTRLILNDMIRSGAVKRSNLRKLTSSIITKVLVKYTKFTVPKFFIKNGSAKGPFSFCMLGFQGYAQPRWKRGCYNKIRSLRNTQFNGHNRQLRIFYY